MSNELATTQGSRGILEGDAFSNPDMYEHAKNIAGMLAHGAFTPAHLVHKQDPKRTLATCTRIVIQALRWGFDPFAVADETYEIHGRLGYQGKLIIGVVNARAGLQGRLKFTYNAAKGDALQVTVTGQFIGESEERTVTLTVGQAKTANSMWLKDPEQKLAYSGAIKWARRHCPELVMGVKIVEDLEAIAAEESRAARPAPSTLEALADHLLGVQTEQEEPINEDADDPSEAVYHDTSKQES